MSGILLGLLLSLPVGIAVNLRSPAVSRLLERRTEKAAERRELKRAAFAEEAARFVVDSGEYNAYLLTAVLRATLVTALAGALAGGAMAFYAFGRNLYSGFSFDVQVVLLFAAQIAGLLGTILVLHIVRNALFMAKQVQRSRRNPTVVL